MNLKCSSDISKLSIRVLYTRIFRIRVCQYAHIRVYASLLCIPISFFIWRIVVKQGILFLWEWERFQSELCILLKTYMLMNESYISSFRSLHKFTDKLPFLWHLLDLKLRKMGRKLKQLPKVPILKRELYVFTRTDLCFSTCPESPLQNVYLALRCKIDPRWKNGYIWHKSFIQTVKCSFSNQITAHQSFCGTLLTLSYFLLQGKVLCFGSYIGKSVTCEMFIV